MDFKVKPEVKILYPSAHFGGITVHNLQNQRKHSDLEQAKRNLEANIRENYPEPKEDHIVLHYVDYYSRWEKTYPIIFQINSIKKGRTFPQVSTYVDSMFLAELEDRILTSGHDRDTIQGELIYDLADDGEEYVKLNNEKQVLVKNDVVLRDDEGILASILFGPAARTSITKDTVNPLYLAWCPIGIESTVVDNHLSNIAKYLGIVYGELESERKIN